MCAICPWRTAFLGAPWSYPQGIARAARSGHNLNQGLANFGLLTDCLPLHADADRSFSKSERTPWQPMNLCN
ncbi:hypothetical protein XACLG97_10640002 [Xanthomonas citri pv. citri]|nr:hypothetical protein XACLG97_10640002 [Xanthomonas citri pv. citri]